MSRALLFVAFLVSCHEAPCERVSTTTSVVFVLANWSAPSVQGLRQIKAMLAADPHAPPLVIVDTDDEAAVAPLQPVAGWGETFWIRDGKIVARILRADELTEAAVKKNNALLR